MVEQSRIFDEAPEIAKEAAAAASLAKELAVALTEDALEAIKQVCGLLQLSPEFCRFAKLEYLRDYAFLTHYALQARIESNLRKILQKNRRCHFDKRDAPI